MLVVQTESEDSSFNSDSGSMNIRFEAEGEELWTKDDTSVRYPSDFERFHAIALDPQQQTVALGLPGGAIELRDASSGEYIWTLYGHERGVYALSFGPAEYTLASASMDGTVRVWDTYSGRLMQIIEGYGGSR